MHTLMADMLLMMPCGAHTTLPIASAAEVATAASAATAAALADTTTSVQRFDRNTTAAATVVRPTRTIMVTAT
jgi:hypothetical protein